jgi:hypothetical protein
MVTSTSFTMRDGIVGISLETFTTVMTISAGGVVFAVDANATALSARQQEKLLVKAALIRMIVTIAS